jgi:hypothetical protein
MHHEGEVGLRVREKCVLGSARLAIEVALGEPDPPVGDRQLALVVGVVVGQPRRHAGGSRPILPAAEATIGLLPRAHHGRDVLQPPRGHAVPLERLGSDLVLQGRLEADQRVLTGATRQGVASGLEPVGRCAFDGGGQGGAPMVRSP